MKLNQSFYIGLLIATTLLQVFIKVKFDGIPFNSPIIAFHLVWMSLLHLSIYQIFFSPESMVFKIIMLSQIALTIVLSVFLPELHITLMMSLAWMVLVKMFFLLKQDRLLKIFDVLLFIAVSTAVVGTLFRETGMSLDTLKLEVLSNASTFILAFFLFRHALMVTREKIQASEEKNWHNRWYFTMMQHFSHNLRTPMTVISTNTELLRLLMEDQSSAVNITNRLVHGSEKLHKMVNSLVQASSINNISAEGELLQNVVSAWRINTEHAVEFHNQMTLPVKIAGPEIISLLMALDAFVDNSYKYGASQFIINADDRGITISDNGPGLTEEIFNSLGEAHLNADQQGNGLGIYYSFALLRESGWEIEVVKWRNGLTYRISRKHLQWVKEVVGVKG